MLVVPGRGHDPAEALNRRLGRRVWVVHRIDREASGLVLFALDAPTHRRLSGLFEGRAVEKTYAALVLGDVAADGVVDGPLREFGSGRMGVHARGKASVTHYRVLRRDGGATLLEVRPVTGRRHQIRVHLYSIGHPVLGDAVYGDARPVGGAARLMLHAWRLALEHPAGGVLRLEAPVPGEFGGTSIS